MSFFDFLGIVGFFGIFYFGWRVASNALSQAEKDAAQFKPDEENSE